MLHNYLCMLYARFCAAIQSKQVIATYTSPSGTRCSIPPACIRLRMAPPLNTWATGPGSPFHEVRDQLVKCIYIDGVSGKGDLTAAVVHQVGGRLGSQQERAAEILLDGTLEGMVFHQNDGNRTLYGDLLKTGSFAHPRTPLSYVYYEPETADGQKHPLIIWLHGAGEGGMEPAIAATGNKVASEM